MWTIRFRPGAKRTAGSAVMAALFPKTGSAADAQGRKRAMGCRWKQLWMALFCAVLLCGGKAQAWILDGNAIMDQPMRENLCVLTFDDGPSPNTPQLLDSLAEYGIPATFFLLGRQAERFPDLVRRTLAEGHEVGNHSYSHPNFRRISPARRLEELRRTDDILRKLGAAPRFFRPPYGAFEESTEQIAEGLGLTVALWSLDSRDWQRLPANYAQLLSTRGSSYAPGTLRGVFLFHDTHKRTVDDLPRIVRDLRAGGCQRFVTLSDYVDGLLDPEPGMRMVRRALPAPEAAAFSRGRPAAPEQPVATTQSFPAGTAALPLARSSRPWSGEAVAQENAPQPQAAQPPDQADHPASFPPAS